MIDKWFKKDIDEIYKDKNIIVFIDESKEAEFLLNFLPLDIKLFKGINNEIDELHVKYQIEKASDDKKYLIYTNTAKNKLKFIREYCETEGVIEINSLAVYIRKHLNKLNINLNLSDKDLAFATKISISKKESYWKDIKTYGKDKIFNINEEILVLLENPNNFKKKYNDDILKDFYHKINDFINHPYNDKLDFNLLANQTAKYLFNLILEDKLNEEWSKIYENLLNSKSHEEKLKEYLEAYKKTVLNGKNIDIWTVPFNHPFYEIDKMWLDKIINEMKNGSSLDNYLEKIKNRLKYKNVLALIEIDFWDSLVVILTFEYEKIAELDNLDKCIKYYKEEFYKLDNAMNYLYKKFLNDNDIIAPIQEKYRNFLDIFLDKWFRYFNEYQQNQTGVLQKIISENPDKKVAVIVADALTYVVSKNIISKSNLKSYKCIEDVILCDTPSETENNMSQIYIDDGQVKKFHKDREKYLFSNNKNIEFVKIEDIKENINYENHLIATHKDIDTIGEKLHHNLIDYFSKIEENLSEKIDILVKNGFYKVYLISDHGFIFTGKLEDSDKINVNFIGKPDKKERYIRSIEKQSVGENLIEIKKQYKEYEYLYFAKSISPFKTTGKYGFSHGGISPQELITPFICWQIKSKFNLRVDIINKESLEMVEGNLFKIKIKGTTIQNSLLYNRRVQLVSYNNKKEVSKSDVLTIKNNETLEKEFDFNKFNEIKIVILDVKTYEQLDSVIVKKGVSRDLDGLL